MARILSEDIPFLAGGKPTTIDVPADARILGAMPYNPYGHVRVLFETSGAIPQTKKISIKMLNERLEYDAGELFSKYYKLVNIIHLTGVGYTAIYISELNVE